MTHNDLRKIQILQTAMIHETINGDAITTRYIINCLHRFYEGDYGTICEEDTQANNNDLEAGYGHVLARYEKAFNLKGDIYIEAHFDKDNLEDIDYTNILIMYPEER